MPIHNVVLVPGFFGFGNFGDLRYFSGVREAIEREFARRGVELRVTEVATLPTASIRQRAASVLEVLSAIAEHNDGPLHIIGHSTGGLDARLAIAPTASLPTSAKLKDFRRVRTLVTVCCPHFGTPLAAYFSDVWGRFLLRTVAAYFIFWLERGKLPVKVLLRLWHFVVRLRDPFKKRPGTFDELYQKLLGDFSDERRLALIDFLKAVSLDQSLLFQLTPASCDLLNACTADPDLRYGSVIARAPKPSFRLLLRSSFDLYSQIVYPVYALCHRIAARGKKWHVPEPVAAQREKLAALAEQPPSAADNDGIVPTYSQIWGSVLHVAEADHLDVVGQYGFHDAQTLSGDWLPSYSRFDRAQFETLWSSVARFIAEDADSPHQAEERAADADRTARDQAMTNPK